ncbi:MAG: hypothetical protein OEM60_08965 [Gammaproteobacteria bacterium]|nr:hypothetical protein [Gammaproteobacteria bacterium]MDH3433976.1 hypothetical protein [Gammaproteobacteria bacterium]
MSRLAAKLGVLTAAAVLQFSAAGATEQPQLAHNPFARPPSRITAPVRPSVRTDGSTQEIDLRATLVASSNRLANVAGRILRPGDEVQGYTLIRVYENRAIFAREGSRLTIYVKPDLHKDDE